MASGETDGGATIMGVVIIVDRPDEPVHKWAAVYANKRTDGTVTEVIPIPGLPDIARFGRRDVAERFADDASARESEIDRATDPRLHRCLVQSSYNHTEGKWYGEVTRDGLRIVSREGEPTPERAVARAVGQYAEHLADEDAAARRRGESMEIERIASKLSYDLAQAPRTIGVSMSGGPVGTHGVCSVADKRTTRHFTVTRREGETEDEAHARTQRIAEALNRIAELTWGRPRAPAAEGKPG